MKGKSFIYWLIAPLSVVDAWLISHPNALGRLGVWFYKYQYISTFPKALLTVGLSVGVALGIAEWAKRQLRPTTAQKVLGAGLGVSLILLGGIVLKFSGGTYAHTGKAFIWGFYLLPLLMMAVFGSSWWQNRRR